MELLQGSKKLDREWVSLLKEAKALGLSKDDIREFIHRNVKKSKNSTPLT